MSTDNIRCYLQGLPRRKLHEVPYVTDELMLNDEIPSRVAMLVRDLISYRNRAHVTGYNGSCKKQTQKRGFLNDNKGIDTIDLPKTLHSKRVTKPIPSFLDIVTPPIISFTYPKTIASNIEYSSEVRL